MKNFLLKYGHYILLIALIAGIYSRIVKHDFLYFWDDQWVVMNNYTEGDFTWNNLWCILTDFYHGQYAPLNELCYLILYNINGYDARIFHLASLIWHAMNGILCFIFISKLLELQKKLDSNQSRKIALLTSVVFLCHPVNVESVAWVSAAKVLVYSFFYLVALICYLKYVKEKRMVYYFLTFLFFVFSFGGKEQAVTLPVCLLLIDYFLNRDFFKKEVWIEKFPFFIMALFFGLLTIASQSLEIGKPEYPFSQRFILAHYTLFEYLVKSLLPLNLSYLYPFPMQPYEAIPGQFRIYPLVLLCLIGFLYIYRKNKYVIFSFLFFIIHIGVALHIISLSRYAIVADRYTYMSSIGVAFLLAYFIIVIVNRMEQKKVYMKRVIQILCGVYILYFIGYSSSYVRKWENTDTLKSHVRQVLNKRKNLSEELKILEKNSPASLIYKNSMYEEKNDF